MSKGNEEAGDQEVKLEVLKAMGRGDRVVGFGDVSERRFEVGGGGGDEMVEC